VLRSMTGYGGSENCEGGRRVRVEIRSVNQRFLDLQIKAPRSFVCVEDRIRRDVESRLARGRVTVFVDVRDENAASVVLNVPAARRLAGDLAALASELGIPGEIDISSLAAFPQIFEQPENGGGADAVWAILEPALTGALDGLVAMREAEGRELATEITSRLTTISGIVESLEAAVPALTAALRDRTLTKIRGLIEDVAVVDEARLAQEAAIAAERADVVEEIVRLKAHITQALDSMPAGEPVGKRLNFLVQEMHREANTIGSKSADTDVSATVVTLKEEIERLREQVQNVE
jgi:uncharacterized protein (TIGR00255 family)